MTAGCWDEPEYEEECGCGGKFVALWMPVKDGCGTKLPELGVVE